jgi:DNA modification methylase
MAELEDNSVTGAIVSSPPYFRQRVFTANGAPRSGSNGTPELGQELKVQDYVENLCVILAECARVMSPTSSFYLNLGDTYQEGNLLNVPARVAIAVQDQLGLILKQTLIWWKSGSIMPESTKRRRMNDYEFVYHFVKDRKQYYYDADQIRLPYESQEPVDRKAPRHYDELEEGVNWRWVNIADGGDVNGILRTTSNVGSSIRHAAGKIPGAVMEISRHCPNLEEFGIAHSAGFPAKLVKELLKPVVQPGDVVLDPFSGSGTVGVVALEHGCEYVGYEINSQFAELGMKRIKKSCLPAYQNRKRVSK